MHEKRVMFNITGRTLSCEYTGEVQTSMRVAAKGSRIESAFPQQVAMTNTLQSILDAQYDAIIARLREIAPRETEEFLGVVAARKALQSPPESERLPYIYFDSVGEAILDWFKRRNNGAATEDELKNGVLAGGLLLHSSHRDEIVRASIRSQTSNAPYAVLRKVGSLIEPKRRL